MGRKTENENTQRSAICSVKKWHMNQHGKLLFHFLTIVFPQDPFWSTLSATKMQVFRLLYEKFLAIAVLYLFSTFVLSFFAGVY